MLGIAGLRGGGWCAAIGLTTAILAARNAFTLFGPDVTLHEGYTFTLLLFLWAGVLHGTRAWRRRRRRRAHVLGPGHEPAPAEGSSSHQERSVLDAQLAQRRSARPIWGDPLTSPRAVGDNRRVFTRRPIERTREGDFRLRLSDAERQLLRELPAQLLALLTADPEDPSLRRLRPTAYEDDAEAEDEFRRLMDGELLESRREALLVLVDTAARDRLTAEELDAWLRALTDLRLAVGTRLDVTEDTYAREIDPRDPQAYELSVFAYLSWLQDAAVEAAMEG